MKAKKNCSATFNNPHTQQILTPLETSAIRVFLLSDKQPPKNIQFYNAPV